MFKNIFFDLDGTLTDPKIGITTSVQYALMKMGIIENDLEKLINFIGPPLKNSFIEYYGMNDEEAERAIYFYRERYGVTGIYENSLFDGVFEMLENLFAKEKTIILATSKPAFYAEKILKHFKIDKFFSFISGSTMDCKRTDKKEVISYIFDNFDKKLEKTETVMVGDRKHDILGAKSCGIKSIAVTFGYGSFAELSEEKPDFIVNSVKELEKILV